MSSGQECTPQARSPYDPESRLLASLDEAAISARPWEFAMRLRQLAPAWPESEKETLQVENEILHLQSTPPWRNSDRRFRFEFQFTDGSVWPDLDRLNTPGVTQYLRGRLDIAKHPALRARYGDLLWELASDHTAARAAVESYLTFAEDLLDGGHNLYGADAIARAADLALRLSDTSLAAAAVTLLMQRLERAVAESNENACSWLAEALLAVPRAARPDQIRQAAQVLEMLANALAQESPGAFPVEELHKKVARLCRFSGNGGREEAALRRVAECIEARARLSEQDSHMRAAHFYGEAEAAYRQVGDRAKVEDVRSRMREQSGLAEEHEFRAIKAEIPWPAEEISKLVSELRQCPLQESIMILASHPQFAPSLQNAREEWERTAPEAVFLQFVTPALQRDGLQVWAAQNPDEIREYNILRTFLFNIRLNASFVANALKELLADGDPPATTLADLLAIRPFYADTDKAVLLRGLEYYFAQDWIGALHVLPPYAENLLRLVLKKIGLLTFSAVRSRPGAFREKDLDTVLQTPELRRGLGEDFCAFAELILSDPRGAQLRHRAAHGLLSADSCSGGACDLLIHLLLLLAGYEIKRSNGASGSEIPKSSP